MPVLLFACGSPSATKVSLFGVSFAPCQHLLWQTLLTFFSFHLLSYIAWPPTVFCVFNSFVHTWMYTYYFFAAMRWPFPRAVKRNLTTMQIAQIASGTFLTNLYLLIKLKPTLVAEGYKTNKVSSWYQNNPTRDESLFGYALARSASSDPETCLQSIGAEIALHVNTMYMFVSVFISSSIIAAQYTDPILNASSLTWTSQPLLALFFNFFMRSYLQKAPSAKSGQAGKPIEKKAK